jgi:hypothetical protein
MVDGLEEDNTPLDSQSGRIQPEHRSEGGRESLPVFSRSDAWAEKHDVAELEDDWTILWIAKTT